MLHWAKWNKNRLALPSKLLEIVALTTQIASKILSESFPTPLPFADVSNESKNEIPLTKLIETRTFSDVL